MVEHARPVEPRDAATVLLLRTGPGGQLEVFLQERRSTMAFAAGVLAFPGGGVESFDHAAVPADWPARMGAAPDQAAGVVGALLREVAEETSVRLGVSDLGLWDAWTTPAVRPRRYRTWFFTALVPDGQEAFDASTEASRVLWLSPAEAIAWARAGEVSLMPPTFVSLARLAGFGSSAEVMAHSRAASVEMFTPAMPGDVPAWAAEAGIVWTKELWSHA